MVYLPSKIYRLPKVYIWDTHGAQSVVRIILWRRRRAKLVAAHQHHDYNLQEKKKRRCVTSGACIVLQSSRIYLVIIQID